MIRYLGRWSILAALVAIFAGTASAAFLFALDWAGTTRDAHPGLIWLLPLAGFVVGWVYLRIGQSVEAGNNLLIDEIHDPQRTVPLRMAPLVAVATVVSHLFGASVGREGTAVQMGGALADQTSYRLRLNSDDRRTLLMAGIAAGFASVFGTPIAGAVFALEVLAIGKLRLPALLPCLLAAFLADRVGQAWGVHHTHYPLQGLAPTTVHTVLAVLAAGALFGLIGMLFARTTHGLGRLVKRRISYAPMRPFLGGIVVTVAVWALDAYRYIGLGIPAIVDAFVQPAGWDFLGKFVFTVVSLGTGFKGGEVTPLFFIGATFGNAMAPLLDLPFSMLAGLGFVAVFAGAANTPIAGTIMAMEMFGPAIGPFAALACLASYLFSGHAGIYGAQRVGSGKFGWVPVKVRARFGGRR
ncbi:voltage-gated chloride channel family protein [Pigmentiphaga aceris]|uniref:Voltage-gated chloride channel family protein n=1 Tax=Pigmentiphaga aceris TaxID=1940612 RepID=A0A5C0AWP3_9BURK|nr:voltage-gated chloride channel family protein [Pigmentiphaga aceris]QEI06882.1 voltage-gated chloride channel family protein [Pigmentiphaga aceris]